MTRLNIYGMYAQNDHKAGFWVRRNSWSTSSFAQVKTIAGAESGPLAGKPPYHERQKVSMDFYFDGRLHETNAELSCPGTYAYTLIADPRKEPNQTSRPPEGPS